MRYQFCIITLLLAVLPLHANEVEDFLNEKGSAFNNAEIDVERPSSLTNLESEPSTIVNGSVNVISGDFTDSDTDMVLPCAEPLILQKCYQSSDPNTGSMCKSWNYNHFGMLTEGKRKGKHDKKIYTASILGAYGSQISYEERDKDRYRVSPLCLEKGITNISQGVISGRTNSRNERLDYNKDTKQWVLRTGAGDRSIFEKGKSTDIFLLKKEKKANANSVDYYYDKANCLNKVETKNREGKSLASYSYNLKKHPNSKTRVICDLTSHDQRTVSYIFDKIKVGPTEGYYLLEAQRPEGPTQYFTYAHNKGDTHARLTRKHCSDNRFQEIEYYTKGAHQLPHYVVHLNESNNPFIGRVKLQKAPVGTDATPIITHQFCYYGNTRKKKDTYDQLEVLDGYTQVFDAYNRMTSYSFDEGHRLVNVEKYLASGHLYSSEKLFWGDPYRPFATNLMARAFVSVEEGIHYCKNVEYDHRYNVQKEYVWGNHSGWNPAPVTLQVNGTPFANGCEVAMKSYTYSAEGMNLLMSETDGPVTIRYRYHPDTDLLASKITLVHDIPVIRAFYEYDANAMVSKEIVDDGTSFEKNNLTSVTERHIKITRSTTNIPIGLPEIIEERVFDIKSGTEKLLTKTVNHYSPHGRLVKKEVFDSNEQFAYANEWEYDAHGNITRETNALGHSILRQYDVHNNLVSEQGPRFGSHTNYLYDFTNRLIRKELIADNGQSLTEHYRYDYVNQKVGHTDIHGNETRYQYDEFGRLTHTIHPFVCDEHGQAIEPVTKTTYDPMSLPKSTTDACGATTYKKHTIKGKPYHMIYPDGTEEKHTYNLNGTLQKTVHVNGTYTLFSYDGLQRLLSKITYSPSGEILTSTSSTYNSFHLLSETDAAGYTTYYHYDMAGRLIETKKGNCRITQQYDSLGRVNKVNTFYGLNETDYVAATKCYDAANQIIEEKEEDHQGNVLKHISYSYDEAGNKISVTVHTEMGPSTSLTEYDYCNRPTRNVDPLGNETITTYNDNFCNQLGQKVLYQETTDACGVLTAVTKDALGRIVHIQKRNSLGQVIRNEEHFYDANGNKRRQVDSVLNSKGTDRQVLTLWEYDSCSRLVCQTQAFGTQEQKCTRTIYNSLGQKELVIKADGTFLHHTYDLLGRLEEYFSNDGSIHYRYHYDSRNNAIQVEDLIQGRSTYRTFDENNCLVQECLGNGLTCSYTYDAMGRPIKMMLPDGSSIVYGYQASHLHTVERITSEGVIDYTHAYTAYTLAGNQAEMQLANGLGKAELKYNLLGQITSHRSPYFEETCDQYDAVGNLCLKTQIDPCGTIQNNYVYDDLYQILSETGASSHEYQWDSLYNRIAKDKDALEVNSLNQLVHNGHFSFEYDHNGNLIKKNGEGKYFSYEYDAMDRLKSVTLDGHKQIRYTYDMLNRRLSRTNYEISNGDWLVSGETEYFLYLQEDEVGRVDISGTIQELRILGGGKGAEIGAAVALELQGKSYVPIHDQSGNVAVIVDMKNKQIVEHYRYSAFGEEIVYDSKGHQTANAAPINPWRFSSKRVDPETGFSFFGRRYYDPVNGKWITADPLGFEAGPNLYAYVHNNPLTHFDLYGLFGVGMRRDVEGPQEVRRTDRGARFFSNVWKAPGRAIEYIGKNFVPIPVVRDGIEIVGRLASGKGIKDYTPSWKTHSGYFDLGLPEKNPLVLNMLYNGMNTSKQELHTRLLHSSKILGGNNMHAFWTADHGFIYNLIGAGLQKCGIVNNAVRESTAAIRKLFAKMDAIGPGGIINIHSFSQGNLVMNLTRNRLTREEAERINFYSYGSPIKFDGCEFNETHQINDCKDPIAMFCSPIMNAYNWCTNKCHFQHSESLPFMGHCWDNNFYQSKFTNYLLKSNE